MANAAHPQTRPAATLVSFLGTGNYQPVHYHHEGQGVETAYFPRAAAELFGATRVCVLATAQARQSHGDGLKQAFSDRPGTTLSFRPIPSGSDTDQLWQIFETLLESLESGSDRVILDITHGFRTLPFFAAAATAYLRAGGLLLEDFTVVYGAFVAKDAQGHAPVWELTAFLDLLDWAHGVGVFATTGLADPLLTTLRRQDAVQKRQLARQGQHRFPRSNILAGAIESFADDLLGIRLAALVCGVDGQPASSQRLRQAIDDFGQEAGDFLPALRPLLERITATTRGITAPSLFGPEADRALRTLARRYLAQRHHAEAAVVVREAWVSRYANDETQTNAGRPGFDEAGRRRAEERWNTTCQHARTVANVRNDIEHGGFRLRPLPGNRLREQIRALVETLQETVEEGPPPKEETEACVWFVSRHPGAMEWARQQGIAVNRCVTHLDPDRINTGDTVIGTLPVHQAARVCARGGRYLHLVLELPADTRGRELDAREMEQYGARLTPFSVQSLA